MHNKTNIQHHFDKLAAQASASLDAYAYSGQFEALHQFRVQVKKLRAILRIYTNHVSKKQLASLKKIFRAAGAVRTAGIHADILRQMGADKTILLEQYKEYNKLSNRFRRNAGNNQKHFMCSCQALRKNFEEIYTGEIIWRFLDLTDRIGDLLSKPGTADNRHQARMMIKDVIYAYPLAGEAVQNKLRLNIPYLDDLQEKIGSWHDTVIFTDWLTRHELMDTQFRDTLQKQRNLQKAEMEKASHVFCRLVLL